MVVVETKFDKKTYIDYFKFDSITQDYKFKMAVGIALAGVIGAGVAQYLGEIQFRNTALVISVMFIVFWFIHFFSKLSNNLKNSGLNRGSVGIKYEINDKKIVWNNKTTNQYGSSKWVDIKKVRNNGRYIYMYISKTHALVINTEHIVSGTADEIRNIAKEKVKNYK